MSAWIQRHYPLVMLCWLLLWTAVWPLTHLAIPFLGDGEITAMLSFFLAGIHLALLLEGWERYPPLSPKRHWVWQVLLLIPVMILTAVPVFAAGTGVWGWLCPRLSETAVYDTLEVARICYAGQVYTGISLPGLFSVAAILVLMLLLLLGAALKTLWDTLRN